MTLRTPTPTPTGPVGTDIGAGEFFIGVAFIAGCFVLWPAATLLYDAVLLVVGGGSVIAAVPDLSSVLGLAAFALLAGLASGVLRLALRERAGILPDLVEAALGAASGGQITLASIALNLAIGLVIGLALSILGIASPFDVLATATPLFAPGGALAVVIGGGTGGPPAEWWDVLLLLALLLTLLGTVVGALVGLLFAWVGQALGATAGRDGSPVAAALVLSLTRLWRAERNPYWQPDTPLPRELGDLMRELTLFESELWRREPRRDLFDAYLRWLDQRGIPLTTETFIAHLPNHRDWLRTHGTTQGQRYLGAFADRMRGVIDARREEIERRAARGPVSRLTYSDGAPPTLDDGATLAYDGWRRTALSTGALAGLTTAGLILAIAVLLGILEWTR